jgi:replication factor C small subunit
MNKKEILNEIARPKTLEGFMCNEVQLTKFENYIKDQSIPHIGLFSERPGCGKSTLAKILVKNIDCDYIYLNAMDNRGMDSIKEKVGSFASAGSFKPLKIVILDESTHILEAGQVLLLNMMETFSANTRFILTGNYPERLIEPLRSRLQEFELIPPQKSIIASHVYKILQEQEIECSPEDLKTIINDTYPDLRKTFNTCEKFIINNKIVLGKNSNPSLEWKDPLLSELKKPNSKSLNIIRQILVNSNKNEYSDVYKFLYDKVDDYGLGNEGELIILIEEGLYKAQSRLSKEINIVSSISKILKVLR